MKTGSGKNIGQQVWWAETNYSLLNAESCLKFPQIWRFLLKTDMIKSQHRQQSLRTSDLVYGHLGTLEASNCNNQWHVVIDDDVGSSHI